MRTSDAVAAADILALAAIESHALGAQAVALGLTISLPRMLLLLLFVCLFIYLLHALASPLSSAIARLAISLFRWLQLHTKLLLLLSVICKTLPSTISTSQRKSPMVESNHSPPKYITTSISIYLSIQVAHRLTYLHRGWFTSHCSKGTNWQTSRLTLPKGWYKHLPLKITNRLFKLQGSFKK